MVNFTFFKILFRNKERNLDRLLILPFFMLLSLTIGVSGYSQTQTTHSAGPNDAVILSTLDGSGVVLSNPILVKGDRTKQIALFSGGIPAGLAISNGILFSTGLASDDLAAKNAKLSVSNEPTRRTPIDPDLATLNADANNDAVVYTFKVTLDAKMTAIRIFFQFGSEEYPDFVGSKYNDVFGFFISGPGITGTKNIAKLPSSDREISVNSVNGGVLGVSKDATGTPTTDLGQTAYYINNGHTNTGAKNTGTAVKPVFVEYNGLTKMLSYDLTGLTPGATYDFKIAIADVGDGQYDSGVFVDVITASYGADLSVKKEVVGTPKKVGDEAVFTITASNAGPYGATGVKVNDLLPSGYTFTSASPSVGTYNTGTGVWNIGTLGNRASATLTVRGTLKATGDHNNIASITGIEEDPDLTNNESSQYPVKRPTALNDTKTTNEDTPVTINVTANDTDPDGTIDVATVDLDPATAGIQTTFSVTGQGTYSVDALGVVTFTPAANYNGVATAINYTVNDKDGFISNSATITVTVTAVNDKPVAVNDNAETDEDTVVTIDVTANDTDVDGTIDVASVDLDPATAGIQTSFSVTGQGTYSVDNSGIVTFTPAANYNGTTTPINYTVHDNQGAVSASATITVKVKAVNDKPVAVNDSAETDEDTVVTIDVTANDTDVDGTIDVTSVDLDPATAGIQTSFSVTGQGTYSVDNSGIVTFTPAANYNGTTTPINYTVNDNQGAVSASATITVKVKAVNDKPVAVNDNAETDEDTVVTIDVTANDTDVDGTIDVTSVDLDPATTGIQTSFSVTGQGTYSVDNSGIVTFTPAANYNGTTTPISYTVQDNQGAVSASATITVKVKAVNDKPVAVNDNAETDEDTVVTIDVTANDTDVDGTIDVASVDLDPATAGIQTSFSVTGQGTYSVDALGIVTFTPAANYNGTTTPISYTVNDNQGAVSASATITVKVKAVNDKPVAVNDNAETDEDTVVTIDVTANDTDVDGTIDVASVDLDPATAGTQKTFSVTGQGTYSVDNSGIVTFTPAANYNGTTTPISYTVHDNQGAVSASATITVKVKAINDKPVAVNDNAETDEDTVVTIDVTANDTDVDGTIDVTSVDLDPATAGIQTSFSVTGQGTYSVDNSGIVTFTPAANYNGTTTPISYTVQDNQGAVSASATITVKVKAVNDKPVAVNDSAETDEDTVVTIDVTANDTDVDGTIDVASVDLDPATAGIQTSFSVTGQGTYSVDALGVVTFTPAANYNGTTTPISYTVHDNQGAVSASATITVKVKAVNDKPVAVNDNAETDEDTVVTIDVTANDTDVDGTIDVASVDLDPATAGIQTSFSVTGQGTYSVDNSGIVTFTPAANYNGTTTPINYTVQDNQGAVSASATITVKVKAVNDKPVAVNDNAETDEDTVVTIDVTANDTDVDGTIDVASVDLDPATAGIQTSFSVTGQGTYSVDNSGIVTFTPAANYNGTTTPINYTVQDNQGAVSASATITVKVKAVNDKPVAVNDNAETDEDTVVTIDVTANDTDVDGTIDVASVDLDPATAGIQTTFSVTGQGTYSVDALGIVTFTPAANYNGTTTPISYTVNDNQGAVSASATITVKVKAVNDKPVAVNDNAETDEDTVVTIDVTANDTDVDGTIDVASVDLDPATAGIQTSFSVTGQGTYSVDNSGIVTFTPAANYNGTTTPINYTVQDNQGAVSASATITVKVKAVNDKPVAVNDNAETDEDTVVTIDVTANDTDVDGTIDVASVDLDPATAGIQTTFSVTGQGTYSVDALGIVTFTPAANYNGTTTPISYTVNDNQGAVSASATITVKVKAVNDKPVAVNDSAETDEDTVVTIDVTANDTDVDGTIDVTSVDLDPATAGIQTSFSVTGQGTYSVDNSGIVTFTPAANYNGTTTPISYTVQDNQGAVSASATITVKVKAVNDKPVAVNDSAETDEDTVVTIDVTANDTDVDGTIDVASVDLDPATAGIQTSFSVTGQGTYSVDNLGIVTFTPAANYNGTTTPINYTVNDNQGAVSASATITVKVKAVNDKPVAVNDSAETDEDTVVTIDVTANDTDVDGTIDVASVDLDPATAGTQKTFSVTGQGTYSVDNSGIVTFTPAANYNGTTTPISYTVNDNQGAVSASATITVKVKAVNDKPVAVNDNAETDEDTVVTIDVTANDTDVDGTIDVASVDLDPATAGIQTSFSVTGQGTYSVDNSGIVTFTPAANYNGTTTPISYTVNDNQGAVSASATITVKVKAVNDKPVADNDTYIVAEGETLTIASPGVLVNDTDVEGDTLTAVLVTGPTHGTLTFNADGSFSYTHDGTETLADSFTYKVNDGTVDGNTVTVNITVKAVNDAPVVRNDINSIISSTSEATGIKALQANDIDGTIASYTILTLPSHGVLAVGGVPVTVNQVLTPLEAGTLTYDPSGTFTGIDTFTFTATDDLFATALTAGTITIPVGNNAPIVEDIITTGIPSRAGVTAISALKGTDTDGTIADYTVLSLPSNGILALDGVPVTINQVLTPLEVGRLTYAPSGAFSGNDIFTFIATDNNGAISSLGKVTIKVEKTILDAKNDVIPSVVGIDKTITVVNVLDNDLLNNTPVVISDIKLGVLTSDPKGMLTLKPDGTVELSPNAPAGDYSLTYEICEKANASNCTSAVVLVTVEAPTMTVTTNSYCSDNAPYVSYTVTGDNFVPTGLLTINWIDSANKIVATQTNMPLNGSVLWPGAIVDANKKATDWPGWILVGGQWIEGNDGFELTRPAVKMQFSLNPTKTVVVNYPSAISGCNAMPTFGINASNDDDAALANGLNGSSKVINVLDNDKLNGVPVKPADVIIKGLDLPKGITLNADGTIDVAPSTKGGNYTVTYQICEKANQSNCTTATAKVFVEVPEISIIKTVELNDSNNNGYAEAGETLTYSFAITNTGNADLENIQVSDPLPGILMNGGPINLAAGQSDMSSISGTYTLTQADVNSGSISNQAIVSGSTKSGITVSDKSDSSDLKGEKPTVLGLSGCVIKVYNAVSSNGDNKNERFYIQGIECYPENTVQIYNRWGVLVFERDHYNNNDIAFRGVSEGRVTVKDSDGLPEGTYYYIIRYKDKQSNAQQEAGYLYLTK